MAATPPIGAAPAQLQGPLPNPMPKVQSKITSAAVDSITQAALPKIVNKNDEKNQVVIAHRLQVPFDFSQRLPKEKTSLLRSVATLQLNPEEKSLLQEMLQTWGSLTHCNLLTIFACDLVSQIERITEITKELDRLTPSKGSVLRYFDDDDGFFTGHLLYFLVLMGINMKQNKYSECRQLLNEDFIAIHCLNNIERAKRLKEVLVSFDKFDYQRICTVLHAQKQGLKKKEAKDFEVHINNIKSTISLMRTKYSIFIKFLENARGDQLLMLPISEWSESSSKKINSVVRCNNLKNYLVFIRKLIAGLDQFPDFFNAQQKHHFAYFDQLLQLQGEIVSKFSKKKMAEFFSWCKKNSMAFLEIRIEMEQALQDHIAKKDVGNDEMMNLLSRKVIMEIFDKWVNDITQTFIEGHFGPFEGEEYITPQSYVKRLIKSLGIIAAPVPQFPVPSDEILSKTHQIVAKSIDQWSSDVEGELSKLSAKCLVELNEAVSASSFSLSSCQLSLLPIRALLKNLPGLLEQMGKLRTEYLILLEQAKKSGKLHNINPQDLKQELQKLLIDCSFRACACTMILTDTRQLFEDSTPNDVLHLIPNQIIDFLTLEGFDEIFPNQVSPQEKAVALPVPVPKDSPAAPLNVAQKAPQMAPIQKQDFKDAKKRHVIESLLEKMGFKFQRAGKGSHEIYQHQETGIQVVLPKHVDALGTRMSIHAQANQARIGDTLDYKASPKAVQK